MSEIMKHPERDLKMQQSSQHERLINVLRLALMAAGLAVFSQISIPLPGGVPMTLQTFALAFYGFWAGSKRAGQAVLLYLLMGALGLPVFAEFKGGFQVFLGPTAGFLLGFLPMVLIAGLSQVLPKRWLGLICGFCGLAACHALGLIGLMLVLKLSLLQAFSAGSLPFLIKDGLSAAAAWVAAAQLDRRLSFDSLIRLSARS